MRSMDDGNWPLPKTAFNDVGTEETLSVPDQPVPKPVAGGCGGTSSSLHSFLHEVKRNDPIISIAIFFMTLVLTCL